MKRLRTLFERLETIMTAVSFAEEGEFDTAREVIHKEKRPIRKVKRDYTPLVRANAARSGR